eukprot:gene10212-12520_t
MTSWWNSLTDGAPFYWAIAIFASVLLSLSIYAKSYKEAAGLISPLMLLSLLPVMVALLPGVELN